MRTRRFTIYKTLGMLDTFEMAQAEHDSRENLLENGYKEEDITNELIQDNLYKDNDIEYSCEYNNLDVTLDNKVVAIADIGRWNGRVKGYKVLGRNLNCILDRLGCEDFVVGSDGYNIVMNGHHHDGSNMVVFREIREGRNIDKFLDKIYNNEEISSSMLNYYTKSLNGKVAEIYGL